MSFEVLAPDRDNPSLIAPHPERLHLDLIADLPAKQTLCKRVVRWYLVAPDIRIWRGLDDADNLTAFLCVEDNCTVGLYPIIVRGHAEAASAAEENQASDICEVDLGDEVTAAKSAIAELKKS